MTSRITIERLLREPNDDIGQTIRDWKIESDVGFVKICLNHGDGFILLR